MKQAVTLMIRGRQQYPEQEPEIIELTTEGTMELRNGGWDITYEESALTGWRASQPRSGWSRIK